MAISWITRFSADEGFFEFNLKCLMYVGLWPKLHWPKRKLFLYKCYAISLTILSVIYLILTGIGTYQHKHDITVLLSNLDKSVVAYNFVLKSMFFLLKRKHIRALITKIANSGDRITEERKRMMFLQVVCLVTVTTGIMTAFCVIATIKSEMTVEAWMPFDPYRNTMSLLLASQIMAVTFLVPCLYRADMLQGFVCSIIMYVCDQLIEVQDRLKNLKYSPENEEEMRNEFKKIIRKHIRLISYSKEINSSFKEYFLVQNLAVTIELCLNAINVTVVGFKDKTLLASFIAFLAIALLNAFIYCYLGNELITQSEGIALAAYESSWTSWPVDLQKDLLLVIRVAQVPMKLTAGGMVAMSLQTYSETLYNGYSIFAVLNDVVD